MKLSYFLGGMVTVAICVAALTVWLTAKSDLSTNHTGQIVEQQSDCNAIPETACDPALVVTNTGPCTWDADDVGGASSSYCYFADWDEKIWQFWVCRKGQSAGVLTIRFEPQGQSHDVVVPKGRGCFSSCVLGLDYDRSNPHLEAVPSQGGFGTKVGRAIPTTVSAAYSGRGTASVNPYNVGNCSATLVCEGSSFGPEGKLCYP